VRACRDSRSDPGFLCFLVSIGSQGAAMAALLAALVRDFFFTLPTGCSSELMCDGMSRSLSGHISTHRSLWTASLRTHLCMSQFHRASVLCFVRLLTRCAYGVRSRSKFCVAVSGFKVSGPLSATVFSEGYTTPTLHVLGKHDILVVEERSRVLIDISIGKRVEEHEGGMR
jgi:hypothetical protein